MEEISLHARQKRILAILNARHGVSTGKEIAAKLGVSERTVRNDISEINARLQDCGISVQAQHGKGYTISIRDRSAYLELFSEQESYVTRDDRIRTLLLRLLRESDWCEMGELEDEMFVSHTTLENDIRTVRKRICAHYPYLKVERRGNYIKLENDEIKRRTIFIRLYAERWDYDSREGIVLSRGEIGQEVLTAIRACMIEVIRRQGFVLDDFSLVYLVMAVAVMYFRVQEGHTVEAQPGRTEADAGEAVREAVGRLGKEWGLTFGAGEYIWLSDILEQLLVLNIQTYSKKDVLESTDARCHRIVEDVLREIAETYEMDLTGDERLFVDLVLHVQALIDGIIAPQLQNHVLGDELRARYPYMGEIAHFLRVRLEQLCEVDLWRDEEDFLLPYLIYAQDTLYQKMRGQGIPVAVLSHLNASQSHYLVGLLHKYFGDAIDLKGPFPIYEKERAAAKEPLLILTTVGMRDFRRLFEAPVLTVSPLLPQEDREKIDQYLTDIKCRMLYPKLPKPIGQYFREDLMYHMKNKESLPAVISAIQDRFYEKNCLIDKVALDLENDYYAVLANGLVFLYQIDPYIKETVGSLVKLQRSISWKFARNIRTILFLAVRPQDQRYLGWFFRLADTLAKNPELQI